MNLFILLIVISFIIPATAIRYAQGQPGSCEPATPPTPTPGVGGTVAQSMENTTAPIGSTENNAVSPSDTSENRDSRVNCERDSHVDRHDCGDESR